MFFFLGVRAIFWVVNSRVIVIVASQEFDILLRNYWGTFAVAEICGDSVIFPCKMTNKYCGDLRRRRVRPKSAQKNVRILARDIIGSVTFDSGLA